jgi:hypothetical protein
MLPTHGRGWVRTNGRSRVRRSDAGNGGRGRAGDPLWNAKPLTVACPDVPLLAAPMFGLSSDAQHPNPLTARQVPELEFWIWLSR